MDDSKIFMFPDGGTRQTSSDVNSLLPLLMCNGGFGGGNWVWIIFLFFLYPLMRNGGLFGNMGQNGGGCLGPLANMVNNNDGRDLIMQAINGNGAAVQRLATIFGTKVDMIQSAICQINNSVAQVDYNNIPANNTSVSYNNGNLIIAESKQTIQSEVEATLQHANYVVEHIEDYKNQITKCEEVLKELNPQFAKDKARDERIAGIETEVAGIKGDIAKILAAVTKN